MDDHENSFFDVSHRFWHDGRQDESYTHDNYAHSVVSKDKFWSLGPVYWVSPQTNNEDNER